MLDASSTWGPVIGQSWLAYFLKSTAKFKASTLRAHDRILRCRINAAFRSQVERRIYAAERGAKRNLSCAPTIAGRQAVIGKHRINGYSCSMKLAELIPAFHEPWWVWSSAFRRLAGPGPAEGPRFA